MSNIYLLFAANPLSDEEVGAFAFQKPFDTISDVQEYIQTNDIIPDIRTNTTIRDKLWFHVMELDVITGVSDIMLEGKCDKDENADYYWNAGRNQWVVNK